MKKYICEYCLYKTLDKQIKSSKCTKYNNISIKNVHECPMGYTKDDIDKIYELEEQDERRYRARYK